MKTYTRSPTYKPQPSEHPLVKADNLWLVDLHGKYLGLLDRMFGPLDEYIGTLANYDSILKIPLESYLSQQCDKEIADLKEEVQALEAKVRLIDKELADSVQVGVFLVGIIEIKRGIKETLEARKAAIVALFINRFKEIASEIMGGFQKIREESTRDTPDIESLSEVLEYVKEPAFSELMKGNVELGKLNIIVGIVEEFQIKLAPEDQEVRFEVLKQPRVIGELLLEREEWLEKEKTRMEEVMMAEQIQFKKELDLLERQVLMFHQNYSIEKHAQVFETVNEANKALARLNEAARKFNSREQLFGIEMTDYSKIQSLIKDFQPYSNLWLNTHNWFVLSESWLHGLFSELDAPGAERFVEDGFRVLNTTLKHFKDKGQQQVAQVAERVRNEIDKFKPNVPLMVALRKEGMKDRHWQAIQEAVGFPFDPRTEGFTFSEVLGQGMLKHTEACTDIGERASKEYTIEMMLHDMWKKWEDINFDLAPYKSSSIMRGYDEIQMVLE